MKCSYCEAMVKSLPEAIKAGWFGFHVTLKNTQEQTIRGCPAHKDKALATAKKLHIELNKKEA